MSIALAYMNDLARVRVTAAALTPPEVRVERSVNGTFWQTVRGGVEISPVGGTLQLDDYEFEDGVSNTYRIVDNADDSVEETSSIVPDIGGVVWLKSVRYPFLNRPVDLPPYEEITRDFRGAVSDVSGRSMPIAVTDLRGSRSWTLAVVTHTIEEARDMDLILAANELMFVHVPYELPEPCGPASNIPGGHVTIMSTSQRRPYQGAQEYLWVLPMRAVVAPGPDVTGGTMTYAALFNLYGSYADVLNANATYRDLLDLVASPADTVVL